MDSNNKELIDAIESWKRTVRYEQFLIDNNLCYGDSNSHKIRIKIYQDTIKALQLELATGEPHCNKCFKTVKQCKDDNFGNGCTYRR